MADESSSRSVRSEAPPLQGTLWEGEAPRSAVTREGAAASAVQNTVVTWPDEDRWPGTYRPPPLSSSRFDDRGEVARGGMGAVHSVFDRVMRRQLAMKVLTPESGQRPDNAEKFCDEARLTGRLNHPNIVPVHDMGTREDDGRVFFTMDMVQGETFSSVIETLQAGPLLGPELERVLGIFLKVCDAVEFAHSRGVIHRDIKPANVMVGSHGQVYLLDWGVALEEGDQSPSGIAGTAAYMSPEQAWGKVSETDERSDIYGLGGILYEILTGRAPHLSDDGREAMAQARTGTVRPPEEYAMWPELPPGLCQITRRALSAAPSERYQSVQELRKDIEQFLRGGGWFSTRVCEAGSTIVREGDLAEAAYIIVEGRCHVQKMIREQLVSLRELGPGEVFGETAVLTKQARTATVVALERTVLKVVTRESLEAELTKNPWLGAFVHALAERFRELDSQLARSHGPENR